MVSGTLSFIAMVYMNTLLEERTKRAIFPYLGTHPCVCECVTLIATEQLGRFERNFTSRFKSHKMKTSKPIQKYSNFPYMYCEGMFTFILLRRNKTNT